MVRGVRDVGIGTSAGGPASGGEKPDHALAQGVADQEAGRPRCSATGRGCRACRPPRAGVVEVPLRVGLQAHRELVEVLRHLVVVVEALVEVGLAVAVEVVQLHDLVAAADEDRSVARPSARAAGTARTRSAATSGPPSGLSSPPTSHTSPSQVQTAIRLPSGRKSNPVSRSWAFHGLLSGCTGAAPVLPRRHGRIPVRRQVSRRLPGRRRPQPGNGRLRPRSRAAGCPLGARPRLRLRRRRATALLANTGHRRSLLARAHGAARRVGAGVARRCGVARLHAQRAPAPARVLANAYVDAAVLSPGSVVAGNVTRSVISTRCRVGANAVIRDSVLLPGAVVGDGCVLDRVIVDSDATIPPGTTLGARLRADTQFYASPEGVVLATAPRQSRRSTSLLAPPPDSGSMKRRHRMPFGAVAGPGGVRFAIWAPAARDARVLVDGRSVPMERAARGFFYCFDPDAARGLALRVSVRRARRRAGRRVALQPRRRSRIFRGRRSRGLRVARRATGTGDPGPKPSSTSSTSARSRREGTYAAATERLGYLAELGVTAVELMPLAATPGRWNWGYDGVLPFAPHARYGRPDDLKRFVDAAHAHNLMVLLDVVYNHFGPDGNYLRSLCAGVLHAEAHDTVGQCAELRRRVERRRPAVLHPQRAVLARGVSLRRLAPRCRPFDRRRLRSEFPPRARNGRARFPRGRRRASRLGERRERCSAASARHRGPTERLYGAMERRLSSRPARASDRRNAGPLRRLRRRRERTCSERCAKASPIRGSIRLIASRHEATRARTYRRRHSSTSSRITTKSAIDPTPRACGGCWSRRVCSRPKRCSRCCRHRS